MANPIDFPPVSGAAAALYYWDGVNWLKWQGSLPGHTPTNPLPVIASNGDKLFSIESRIHAVKSNTNLSAGANDLDGDAVPPGKVWVLTYVATEYDGTVPALVDVRMYDGVNLSVLMRRLAPVSAEVYRAQGPFILAAGDLVRASVAGATAGDDLYLYYNGYQMDAT